MEAPLIVLLVLAALGVGAAVGYTLRANISGSKIKSAKLEGQRIVEEAQEQKRKVLLEAQEEALRIKAAADQDLKERRSEVQRDQRRTQQKDEQLERRLAQVEKKEQSLATKEEQAERLRREREEAIAKLRGEEEEMRNQHLQRLEQVAGTTVAEARELVLRRAEDESKHELAKRYWELEQQYRVESEEKARDVIALAIHRLASDVVSETTTSAVPLPNDEMKGRLIGREGRNIRALEAMTGVDIIIDDTPEVVTISCFDPVRREIARMALQKLIQDGRIHPARIEDVVAKAQKEIEDVIYQAGEQATFEAGVTGLPPELVKTLGRLKYRYSYGENVLKHSIETSLMAGMMAAEVGANAQIAKAGGLLHDIGKALTHEVDGPHAEIGAELCKKHGIPDPIVRCVAEHHDAELTSVESYVVAGADAISAARPGARKETLEHYVKRLEALETVAIGFPGVEKAFAIQAGREVRIMVKPEQIDDIGASALARDVAKQIEQNLVYPGQIKVMVIRETRNSEYAR